jgi:hypothetical protein
MRMENWWNDIDRRKEMYLEENLSQCHFLPHIWTGLGLNLSLHSESLSADHLRHGVATFMLHNIVIV